MPRGKKREVSVLFSIDENGIKRIVKHMYIYNHRENASKIKEKKVYCPTAKKKMAVQVKKERHSS